MTLIAKVEGIMFSNLRIAHCLEVRYIIFGDYLNFEEFKEPISAMERPRKRVHIPP